jgi:hypothetical protein
VSAGPRRLPLFEFTKTKRGQGGASILSPKGGPSGYAAPADCIAFAMSLAKYSGITTIFFSSSSLGPFFPLFVAVLPKAGTDTAAQSHIHCHILGFACHRSIISFAGASRPAQTHGVKIHPSTLSSFHEYPGVPILGKALSSTTELLRY